LAHRIVMAATYGRDLSDAPAGGESPHDDFDEDRSIGEALRVTLLFVAVVILLLWAGVADAANRPAWNQDEAAISSRP
jgi:hypothetical protein